VRLVALEDLPRHFLKLTQPGSWAVCIMPHKWFD
jgi:hypothetical protein